MAASGGDPRCILIEPDQHCTGKRAVLGPTGLDVPRRRYRYIDMLKGWGMLLVMADHCGLSLSPVLDYFEVPVFFFASGFLFTPSTFAVFLRKKGLRLVVPYVVYALLFIVVCMPFGLEVGSLKHFGRLMLAPANYPLWFLKSLLWALLAFWTLWRVGVLEGQQACSQALTGREGRPRPGKQACHNALIAIDCRLVLTLLLSIGLGVAVCRLSHGHELALMTGLPQAVAALPLLIVGSWVRTKISGGFCDNTNKTHRVVIVVGLLLAAVFLIHGHIGFHACNLGEWPLVFYPMAFLSIVAFLALFMAIDPLSTKHMVSNTSVQPACTGSRGVLAPIRQPLLAAFCFLPFSSLVFVGRQSLPYFCLHAIPIYILHSLGLASPWLLLLSTVAITTLLVFTRQFLKSITPNVG